MNYRHAYHAGNFAEVLKHATLARVVAHLLEKPKPFRIVDTHAGAGLTDLTGPEASRTGEWRDGIGRLLAAEITPDARALLAPYLDAVAHFNPGERIAAYPGSPALVRTWLRPDDRLIACELEPGAAAALADLTRGDSRVKAISIDGWTALTAYVPPKERRGAVLIDPPFEQPGELDRLVDGLARAHSKWATGIYLLWYPIKDPAETDAFAKQLSQLGIAKILRAELMIAAPLDKQRLNGTGLILVNPPWGLDQELALLLRALVPVLSRDSRASSRLDWIAGEI